jgi:hypothetical protein
MCTAKIIDTHAQTQQSAETRYRRKADDVRNKTMSHSAAADALNLSNERCKSTDMNCSVGAGHGTKFMADGCHLSPFSHTHDEISRENAFIPAIRIFGLILFHLLTRRVNKGNLKRFTRFYEAPRTMSFGLLTLIQLQL